MGFSGLEQNLLLYHYKATVPNMVTEKHYEMSVVLQDDSTIVYNVWHCVNIFILKEVITLNATVTIKLSMRLWTKVNSRIGKISCNFPTLLVVGLCLFEVSYSRLQPVL